MILYEVAFSGELLPDTDPQQARDNLARLFQADARRIESLFSGRRVVLRQNLDEAAAEKYRAALTRAGVRAEVRALLPDMAEVEEIELAPAPVEAPAPRSTPPSLQVTPRDEYMAAFRHVEAPDFGLAPVGSDLQDRYETSVAPPLDLSALSLAPVGSDLGERPRPSGGPVPDTRHLCLAN